MKLSQKEGIVAIPYERRHAEYSRIHSFAKIFVATGDCHTVRDKAIFLTSFFSSFITDILSAEHD